MPSQMSTVAVRSRENRDSWARYAAEPIPEHRADLVSRYLKLLYRNASMLSRRIPSLEREEAISSGFIGLSQAIDRFEPARGLSFSTFACPRIRGAVLDEVRRQSPRSRPATERRRQLECARRTATARLLRSPDSPEVARELGVSLDEYWVWRDDAQRELDVSLDQRAAAPSGENSRVVADLIPDPDALEFTERVEKDSVGLLVRKAVAALPARERVAIEAHFFEEKPYREVGALLRVSSSRACEIVQRGIGLLRELLRPMTDALGGMVTA
jgi:RNA polymerase sigma factor for flagellar operon FliA